MFSYNKYSWIYKANYWQVAGGKFHWHNPKTNRVEDFNPSQVQGPHTKEVEYPLSDPKQSINESRKDIAAAAQKIVDDWQQDEEGYDEQFGGGGACDAIANEISGILGNKGFTTIDGGQDGDDHAFVIAHNGKQAFIVDIPPSVYETGGGYSWTKRGDAKITPEDVVVEALDIRDMGPDDEGRKAAWDEWKEHHKPKEVTSSPAFKAWFGNSKAVDKDGKPLVLYHGTGKNFTVFDHSKAGREGTYDAKGGFFFTDSKDAADEWTWHDGEKSGKVIPTYLKMENPLRVKGNPEHYDPNINSKAIKMAKEGGYDGIIFENQGSLSGKSNHYVIFDSKQVKAATGNKGTFSPDNPDINE